MLEDRLKIAEELVKLGRPLDFDDSVSFVWRALRAAIVAQYQQYRLRGDSALEAQVRADGMRAEAEHYARYVSELVAEFEKHGGLAVMQNSALGKLRV